MSGYIGNIPVPQATQTRQSFTATASQTTFNTAGYSVGYVDVFLNGVKLAPADYTATNGSDIVLAVGAASGDILETVAYEIFQVVDQDFTGDFTVDGSTFVVDSTNNRVGIGTSSPSSLLDVDKSQNSETNIELTNTNTGSAAQVRTKYTTDGGLFTVGKTSNAHAYGGDAYIHNVDNTNIRFATNDTERMRIDSSGNLLVGKTATGLANQGAEFSSTGQVKGTAPNQVVGYFNRTSSDGDILEFRKDNTTVGSIGTNGSTLYIGSPEGTDAYIGFGNNIVRPVTSSGASRDNAIDLGYTGMRFKDLYLSGGVYLGGVGSSNKLDDYETGSWTPTVTVGSITYANAWYIKIGNLVTLGANVWNFSNTSSSSAVEINLPFTSVTGPSAQGSMIGSFITSTTGYSSYIGGNQSKVAFYEAPSNTLYETMKYNDLSSSSDFHFTLAYYTS